MVPEPATSAIQKRGQFSADTTVHFSNIQPDITFMVQQTLCYFLAPVAVNMRGPMISIFHTFIAVNPAEAQRGDMLSNRGAGSTENM
ncbi:hypothetical protein MGG_15925 [Pyricularia oryzae 70-15]|uniref:Uncharacterized protein n=1 Tax=Pyricularia oryzae (strain 70-15 / ATCC MYA-4617 / FGSC 8958) TaxID=242507 RepID=G4MVZ0_PYRO7|nr:uncharacterized protein MGG_15925 [Pyricularia oryzae 70-15]EHA55858.1 hypothetical protein MGG_15925 [Pyricularia oryzae 70-15]